MLLFRTTILKTCSKFLCIFWHIFKRVCESDSESWQQVFQNYNITDNSSGLYTVYLFILDVPCRRIEILNIEIIEIIIYRMNKLVGYDGIVMDIAPVNPHWYKHIIRIDLGIHDLVSARCSHVVRKFYCKFISLGKH